jgi:TonB family protein
VVHQFILITIACCVSLNFPLQNSSKLDPLQNPSKSERLSSLEKQAVTDTQRMITSELDAELPKLPFASWFERVIGPGAGVIWQLSECGEQLGAPPDSAREMQACAEANAILPDGRKVVVMINVGTFKKGMTGKPWFCYGVIEQQDKLYQFQRLRDLPDLLRSPGSLANGSVVSLPMVAIPKYIAELPVPKGRWPSQSRINEELLPVENDSPSAEPALTDTSGALTPSGAVLWGDAITQLQPRYPAYAKKVKASGPVDVQITISEEGRVIEAKAISGHALLRKAAIEAARLWVFKPATLNGVPVQTQMVLTFVFRAPQ